MARDPGRKPLFLLTVVIACLGVLAASAAEGASPAALEFLRGQGDYEKALDYLEKAKTDPELSEEFKKTIDYEAGMTLLSWAAAATDNAQRESRLSDARKRLAAFAADHPDHELANTARLQSANAAVELGRIQMQRVSEPSTPAQKAARLRKLARKMLLESQEIFAELDARFVEEHQKFPKQIDATRTDLIDKRERVRRDILQTRLALGAVAAEIARTYSPGSAEYTKHLTEAADRYGEFHRKYKMFLAGVYAQLFQARCLKDLGETKRVLQICGELMLLPDQPRPFRDLKTKSLLLAMETHLLPEVKQYEEALKLGEEWLAQAQTGDAKPVASGVHVDLSGDHQPNETTTPDGLAIQYYTGAAALKAANALDKQDPQRAKLLATAAKRLRAVSELPGEHQQEAKELLRQVP